MVRKSFAAAAAAMTLMAWGASPALAQTSSDTAQMSVRVGDLNLRSDNGAKVALRRITSTSKSFCGGDPGRRTLAEQMETSKCVKRMTYMAVNKLDAPMVTAQYNGASAGPPIVFASR